MRYSEPVKTEAVQNGGDGLRRGLKATLTSTLP